MVFEDRVAKYPGRWTIVKSDGTSEVVTLVRNDEPTVEGTPINAATLNELSTVAGAINAKEESISAAQAAASERAKAEQAAANAAENEKNAKVSETESAKNLQGTKEYFEQVRTITIGAQGWYATPEALKTAVPVGENGWWAVVGTTDTIWVWDGDTGAWVDTRKEVDLSDYVTQDQIRKLLEQYMPLRPATAAALGGIKLSEDFTTDEDGTLHLAGGSCPFEIGDILQTTSSVSPAARWGGTWEEIAPDRVLMGASSTHAAGTTAEAGLPNITGFLPAPKTDNYYYASWPISGAFAWSGVYADGKTDANQTSAEFENSTDARGYFGRADFNAARSSAVYGRSSTVQPAAYYVHIWHRVA